MSALPKLLLALTAAAVLSFAHTAKANLVTNGGFETGDFTGWNVGGSPGFVGGTTDGIAPHSGSFQAIVGPAGPGIVDADVALFQFITTVPGQSYTLSFWLANSISIGGPPPRDSAIVSWLGFGGKNPLFLSNVSAFGYTHYAFNLTADSTSTALQFELQISSQFRPTGHWFLDDISLTPTTVPDAGSTFSLLGCASLGLAALRRKLGC
jgi:hypothetical protein